MVALKRGARLGERYRLVRRLGQGGMGEVWEAAHEITGKAVALKALKAERALRPDLVRRMFREARAATAVNHPNVIQVHDVLLNDGSPVMVMDLLEGESFGDRLNREPTLPLEELAQLLLQVVSAVGTAHSRGIVHRDLKPENIFLARNAAGTVQPKVLDFGIAKLASPEGDAVDAGALTRTGSMLGTPFYMAPEQAAGERSFDHRCDIWALGVILYEALSGLRPFEGENFGQVFKRIITKDPTPLAELCPQLPTDVAVLVGRMLRKEPSERVTLQEVVSVLEAHTSLRAPAFGTPLGEGQSLSSTDNQPSLPHNPELETLEEGAPFPDDPESVPASSQAPLLGTLDAATVEQPRLGSRLGALSRRLRTSLVAVAAGFSLVALWAIVRSQPASEPAPIAARPSALQDPPPAALPSAARVATTPEPAPPPAPASSAVHVKRVTAAPSPRPSATPPPAPAPVTEPAPKAESAPKKLPGGILDQEHAPF